MTAAALTLDRVAPSRLAVGGPVEESGLLRLRRVVLDLVEEVDALVVDLDEVTFLPSSAIGVLVLGRTKARRDGKTLTLVAHEHSRAARVLSACGVPHRRCPPRSASCPCALAAAAEVAAEVDGAATGAGA